MQRVGVEGARVLGQVIGSGTCMLESLSLGRNSLGGEGLHALCSGLKSSSSLRALDVSGNLLDDDAIEDGLSMLLQSPCSLRVLDLTDNR